MCDCFHLAFPNWHASPGTGGGRRLRGPEHGADDSSICEEPSQFIEGERPRPQGSSPVEEYPEKYTDSDKEGEVEHDPLHKGGAAKKGKKSGIGSLFDKRSTPKMSKLKEVHSPESEVIVNTAKDGGAEGLVFSGGGKDGLFIKEVVPESPASKNLSVKEGDQILSATVYFDNVTYEDAIQILEHAQAYKVKLCLKRKPDITESEPVIQPEVISGDDMSTPEMREPGKTKRHGDARISWPKFPSFGKGRKSHFKRSHSSSEADEQRKLELSPTTSDTESPIKTQEALKGKKRHKVKLSVLKKRGRVSSSEDQDTDVPTPGPVNGVDVHQTQGPSDLNSPECLDSPAGETPQVFVTDDLDVMAGSDKHKVELISVDSTLKTTDLTMALADQESPSGVKSPEGKKKKKKEKSELKLRIMGKDKSHKKDAKAKSSPKRMQTLGASIEISDTKEHEKSDVILGDVSHTDLEGHQIPPDVSAKALPTKMEISVPKVDCSLGMPDLGLTKKSPKKGKEKAKKETSKSSVDSKHKTDTKTSPTFKLPSLGFTNIATEDIIQKADVSLEESKTKIKQLTAHSTGVKEDPYDRLSKSSLSQTQLPKREDIEIPGMEAVSSTRTTTKGIKEPKAVFPGHVSEIQAETVQMSIDVDSVKEAVSKLPGFKLPQVDTSGVPIPEEITVIDANAQRISVKTPTKVLDAKAKQEAHLTKFDIKASPEISTVKVPKIKTTDASPHEPMTETKILGKKLKMEYKAEVKQSEHEIKAELNKREDIVIPGQESAEEADNLQAQEFEKTKETEDIQTDGSDKKSTKIITPSFGVAKPDLRFPDIGISFPKRNVSEQKGDEIKEESQRMLQDMKTDISINVAAKVPDLDNDIELDGTDKDGSVVNITTPSTGTEGPLKHVKSTGTESDGKGSKFKIPNLGLSMPEIKGPKIDLRLSKKDVDVTLPEAKAEVKLPDVNFKEPSVKAEVKAPQTAHQMDFEGSPSKFKMPTFKLPKLGLGPSNVSAEVPDIDKEIKIDGADINIPKGVTVDVKASCTDIEGKTIDLKTTDNEVEGRGSKFKMPSLGLSMPKVKGPKIDLSLSKKDVDATLPEAKAEVKLPEVPEIDDILVEGHVPLSEGKAGVKTLEVETEAHTAEGKKFKMPKFEVSLAKLTTPSIDLSLPKKHVDVTVPEADSEIQLPDVEVKEAGAKFEVKGSDVAVPGKDVEASPSKFKLPAFKMPKFGAGSPHINVGIPHIEKHIKIDGSDMTSSEDVATADSKASRIDTEGGSVDGAELEGRGSKFKMPNLGLSMPKIKGPQIDLSLSKKGADITLPEAKVEGNLPEVPEIDVNLPKGHISLPEGKVEVTEAEAEIKPQEGEMETEGQESKFKMPKFGISLPKLKGPEIDFSLSKKDADVTQPEAKAEVQLPDIDIKEPSAKIEIKAPQIEAQVSNVEASPSKFKMPTFKLPKFGSATPKVSVDVPDVDKEIKIQETELKKPEAGFAIDAATPHADIEGPSLDVKTTGIEIEGKGSTFKMPHLGISMPKVKGPEIDFNLSKKGVDITLPETKGEIQLPEAKLKEPSAKVEIKPPQVEAQVSNAEGSPLRFKMPTFKLPKFGSATPNVSVEVPDMDKEIKTDEAELKKPEVGAAIDVKPPHADIEGPSLEVKTTQTGLEESESKFKMPKFGISLPRVKGPEIDISLPKKDVDVTLPEAKAEVQLPEVEVKQPSGGVLLEEQPHVELDDKLKKPRFSLPKFSFSKPSVNAPETDASLPDVDVSLPEVKVEMKQPELEIQTPESQMEIEGHESKFKMPKFGISFPKVKGPEIDFSLPKKDVDVTVPEAEVQLPDTDAKEPSAKIEIKAPQIETQVSNVEASPSKFKMPTFKLPKFGSATPNVSVEVPDLNKEIKIEDTELKKPEVEVAVDVTAPQADIEGEALEIETAGIELEGKESKFKAPKFGISLPKIKGPEIDISLPKKDVDVSLPEATAEVQLPEAEVKLPSGGVLLEEQPHVELDAKLKMPRFSLPRFSFSKPSVKAPEIDASIPDVDVSLPEGKVEVTKPEVEVKPPGMEMEIEGQDNKFKMPKFGISMPKVKGPEIDISLSKKDVDVTLPEAKAEIQLPESEIKEPLLEEQPHVELDAKFKKPRFSMPRFSFSKPSVKAPEIDASVPDVDVSLPEGKVEVTKPEVEMKLPESDMEIEGQESKFKMPKFGISMPKVKGPEIDISLSKKDVDVTLPEAKAEVQLPEAEVKEALLDEQPHVELDAKLKKPRFSMPRFSFSKPSVKAPEIDASLPDVDVSLPEGKVEVTKPEVEVKPPGMEMEIEGQDSKFKMPKFGMSMPKVKGPELDFSLSKKDVDITLPEAKAEVQLPEVEVKQPSGGVLLEEQPHVELDAKLKTPRFSLPKFSFSKPSIKAPEIDGSIPDVDVPLPEGKMEVTKPEVEMKLPESDMEFEGQESKFKLPKFGMSMPKVKGPEIDFSLSKKDVDVTLPQATADVQLPEDDVKESSGGVLLEKQSHVELDAKLKRPKFSMPRFSFSKPSVKAPETDASLPDVDVSLPEGKVEVKGPEIEMKHPEDDIEIEGQESKFKMPKFGISLPKVKGPEIDFSLPKKDATLPEGKAEVHLPEAELKQPSGGVLLEEQPHVELDAKLKTPRFSMPRFSFSKPSVKAPEIDASIPDVDVSLPEGKVEVTKPEVEIKPPEMEMEIEGQDSKFKMPKFGISMPKVKGPETDFSLSKKDVDITLPEQPSGGLVEEQPHLELDAKMKRPRFSMPRFSLSKPSVKAPEIDGNLPDVDVSLPGGKMEVKESEVEMKLPEAAMEIEAQGSKFKMPKFGISMPKVKGPETDFTMSKKDVDVMLPEAEVQLPDVKLKEPSGKVEITAPQIEAQVSNVEGSPSKFKMPTFKLPKFGSATPNVSVEVPDMDKEIKTDGAELKKPKVGIAVDVTAPHADVEGPSLEVKTAGIELDGQESRFKMPKFGISLPKVKGPEIDISLPKKDVTLPEAKAEVQLPEAEVKQPSGGVLLEAQPHLELDAKLKKQKFSMPRFSFSKPSVKAPEIDASLPDVDVSLPEGKMEMKQSELEIKPPEGQMEIEGQESKFKMPKFGISMPKVKGPEIDFTMSKKDVDVTLPEAEVQLPDVKLIEPSAKGEIKAPQIEAQVSNVEGSPSKFKMPTFKLPKFGSATPNVSVEVPDMDKEIKADGAELKKPEVGVAVDVTTPHADVEGPSLEVKSMGAELERQESKFKMPKFGISLSKVKGPEIDLSLPKKDVDDVKVPDIEVKQASSAISVPDAPTSEVTTTLKKSTWSMPKFSFSKTDVSTPAAAVKLEAPEVEATLPEAKTEICPPDVQEPPGTTLVKEPAVTEIEAKLKMPRFTLPKFSLSKSGVKEPEIDISVNNTLTEAELKVEQPEAEVQLNDAEGSPSKSKTVKFKLPKFRATSPNVTVDVPEVDKDFNMDGSEPSVDIKSNVSHTDHPNQEPKILDADPAKTETDSGVLGSPSKFKLPSFKIPKLGFSKSKPEDEYVPVDTQYEQNQEMEMAVESQGPGKSPKLTLTSFGEILKSIDVEFDVPTIEEVEEKRSPSKEVCGQDELSVQTKHAQKEDGMTETKSKQKFKFPGLSFSWSPEEAETGDSGHMADTTGGAQQPEKKETNIKQDPGKSPERAGWLKFPKFGLSSPSEPGKGSKKEDHESEKSPTMDTMDEDVSTTCSIRSSDAFADISSTVTSEQVGLSLSSPTKVTVKYSDPNATMGLGEVHGNVMTSTTRTERISVEPNLPEKVTIPSSDVSSSSADTLKLESGKIHVIKSNIQATPEAQHAKLLTDFKVQTAGGLPLKSESKEATSWSTEETYKTQGGKTTFVKRHVVRETSSENRETVVITKKMTHVYGVDPAEPILDDTASSIQRLKDSVHTEKMRFFDRAKK